MAEPLRGAAHRLHPARVPESRPRPWRTAPAPPPDPLLRVLSPGAYTHLSLDKDAPHGRPIERPELGRVIPIREVGGLHHRYVRRATVSWRSLACRESIGRRQLSGMRFWRRTADNHVRFHRGFVNSAP